MNRILVILILAYSSMAFGQFSRKDLMLNGTFLLNSELNPHSTTGYPANTVNSYTVNSSVGLFINKNFEIGGQAGYAIGNREENVRSMYLDFKTTLFAAGIYGQGYFTLSGKLYCTILTSVTLGAGADNYVSKFPITADMSLQPYRFFQFSTLIRPTIIFFPLRRFAVQGGMGSIRYLYSKNLGTGDKQNDIDIDYWPFTIGLTYYINNQAE